LTVSKRQGIVWTMVVVALVVLTAAAWFSDPRHRTWTAGPAGTEDTSSPLTGLEDLGAVPAFAFVSQTGDSVRLADLSGQVWIGDFIFTNCASTCPMMTAQLHSLQEALADVQSVRLVSFSVDPDRDTPERLAEYAAGYGARPERWLFLTGDKAAVRTLSVEGFHLPAGETTPEDRAAGAEAVLHSTRFVLVDQRGHIRGYYDGGDDGAMGQLKKDVRRLVASAS
jgi:protein SCO1/2